MEGRNNWIKSFLQRGPRGAPIAPILKDVREGTYPLQVEEDRVVSAEERDQMKREIYAITAHILEQVHPTLVSDFNTQLAHKEFKIRIRSEGGAIVQEATISTKDCAKNSPHLLNDLAALKLVYPTLFLEHSEQWVAHAREHADSREGKTLSRFRNLLLLSNFGDRARRSLDSDSYEQNFIQRGADTAAEMSWNVLQGIPIIFFNTYGRTITEKEFLELAESAKPLLLQLASMHIFDFSQMAQHLRDTETNGTAQMRKIEFPNAYLRIEDSEGTLRLIFDAGTALSFSKYQEFHHGGYTEQGLGCAGRDARITQQDGSKESLISVVHDMYIEIAKEYLVPVLKPYTQKAALVAGR